MDTSTTQDPARDVAADIAFLLPEGLRIAPMLRTAAAYTYGTLTTRQAFVSACVAAGYDAGTAGVCWAAGRKAMAALEAEE